MATTEAPLPEPDDGHFFLAGAATDPDMANSPAACRQCGNGHRIELCRELGIAACCGGCGAYTHDAEAKAQLAREKELERYEREAREAKLRARIEARKQPKVKRKSSRGKPRAMAA